MQVMGVKMTTGMDEVARYLRAEAERVQKLTIRALANLGERCVIEARDRSQQESWIDRTGNLRSSIGYIITHNGAIVKCSDFSQVKQGSEGTKIGKELAEEIAKRYSSEYVLVVVAGMNYAEYVEAMDNKVVLASAELFANKELPKMMEKLRKQIIT